MYLMVVYLHGVYHVAELPSKGEAYGRADDIVTALKKSSPRCKPRVTVYRVIGKEEV